MKDRNAKDPGDERKIVPLQLAMLEDVGGTSLQARFQQFCDDAYSALMATHPESGEPLYEADKTSAKLSIVVEIKRIAEDSIAFSVDHTLKQLLPKTPGKVRSSMLVAGVGLSQPVTVRQMPLYDKADGQPKPLTVAEALSGKKPKSKSTPAPDADTDDE